MGGGENKNKEKGGVDPSTQKGSVTFDWKQLPVSILRAFLIFIPDKEPYKMNPEDVIKLDDEAVAGAVIAYDKMNQLPKTRTKEWPGILLEAIESGENVEYLRIEAGELKALEDAKGVVKKARLDAARAEAAKASPGTLAKKLVQPPSQSGGGSGGREGMGGSGGSGTKRPRRDPPMAPFEFAMGDGSEGGGGGEITMSQAELQQRIDAAVAQAMQARGAAPESAAEKAMRLSKAALRKATKASRKRKGSDDDDDDTSDDDSDDESSSSDEDEEQAQKAHVPPRQGPKAPYGPPPVKPAGGRGAQPRPQEGQGSRRSSPSTRRRRLYVCPIRI